MPVWYTSKKYGYFLRTLLDILFFQATAEQIRLAQMIYDQNDADFEDKVKQLMEVTGKSQDECIVALHDCNGDVNRAINILLEGSSDTTSWETVGGKKKSLGKEGSENKENREKRGDREVSRGRGSSNRRGRGGSRGREFRAEENGVDSSQRDKPSDRGKRGRGRGEMVALVWIETQYCAFNMYLFSFFLSPIIIGAWKNSVEEWTAEDWNEDLSETKVFTASSVSAENRVTPGQSIDLVTLLQKPVTSTQETESSSFESPQQQTFGQALVFTNSQHSTQMASGTGSSSAVNSYSQSLSAVLCSGFGELRSSKLANSTGSQILDQLKSPGLSQLTSQQTNSSSATASTVPVSSWDLKPPSTQSSVLSQFDFKSQPEPSPVLSQLTQRQQQMQVVPVPPPGLESSSSHVKLREPSPVDTSTAVSKILQLPTLSVDNQAVTVHQTQQKQIKPPKRRLTPASKIPASAVEMPGSADMTGLNVQFGALEFGSEPTLPEFGSTSSSESTSQATNNSLYSKSVNDPLNTSLPISNTVQDSTYTTSAISSSSLTCSSQRTSPVTTSSYDPTLVHSRIAYQSSMAPSEPTTVAVTVTPKTEPSPSLPSSGSLPSVVSTTTSLLPSASQHVAALPSLSQSSDLASSSLSQLNRYSRVDYYGITFPAPATLTGRDGSLANNPYSGDVTKFGRGDSASPAPATTLAQPQQNQTQTHHTTQQPFLNPALPPGYSYTGLPYYAGMPGVPSAFQYGPTMFVPPASAKQHGVNLNTASTPFQQASGYGQHGYGAGYDDLTQGTAGGDYSKGGYSGSSQAQNKSAGSGPGKGYSHQSLTLCPLPPVQTFDKQGFHAGTPPPFSLPSALGSTGPLNPGAAPGYAPAPFLHILPAHQQPHSQMLHHHLQQDGQGGSGQRNQPSTMQQKSQATKTAYGTSPYWTN
uniref:UBA domain-containing protein n=1 Tax=Catharus ustulatus TaxID=91951 RepID=A0A8C3UW10_CATUS